MATSWFSGSENLSENDLSTPQHSTTVHRFQFASAQASTSATNAVLPHSHLPSLEHDQHNLATPSSHHSSQSSDRGMNPSSALEPSFDGDHGGSNAELAGSGGSVEVKVVKQLSRGGSVLKGLQRRGSGLGVPGDASPVLVVDEQQASSHMEAAAAAAAVERANQRRLEWATKSFSQQ
jgi:hypothetical protein